MRVARKPPNAGRRPVQNCAGNDSGHAVDVKRNSSPARFLAIKRIFLLSGVVHSQALSLPVSQLRVCITPRMGCGVVVVALCIGHFALGLAAVIWAGMCFGFDCKKEARAATRTMLWVLITPICCMLFLVFRPASFIGWPNSGSFGRAREMPRDLSRHGGATYTFIAPNTIVCRGLRVWECRRRRYRDRYLHAAAAPAPRLQDRPE